MISLFSFFTIIQELCTCNNLILKSSVLLLDTITGGSDLDPETHGLQHDTRIGLKSFDREESNLLWILCYKETPEGFFFLQYMYLLSPVPLQREQHPPPPPPQPPTPNPPHTHRSPWNQRKTTSCHFVITSARRLQAQRATVFSFALLRFFFSLLFHIKLDRVIKEGWVQSDTARLEQSQQLVCQGNDRREERRSGCPHSHPA